MTSREKLLECDDYLSVLTNELNASFHTGVFDKFDRKEIDSKLKALQDCLGRGLKDLDHAIFYDGQYACGITVHEVPIDLRLCFTAWDESDEMRMEIMDRVLKAFLRSPWKIQYHEMSTSEFIAANWMDCEACTSSRESHGYVSFAAFDDAISGLFLIVRAGSKTCTSLKRVIPIKNEIFRDVYATSHSLKVLFYVLCKTSQHLSTLMKNEYSHKYASDSALLQGNICCLLYYFNNELLGGRIKKQDINSPPGVLIVCLRDLLVELLGQGLVVTEDDVKVLPGTAKQIEPYIRHGVHLPVYDLTTDRVLTDRLCSFSLLIQFFLLGMQNVTDALLAKSDRGCISILVGSTSGVCKTG
ncbi:hypothetical protein GMRT_11052 [Giardia muris]|uniref:Uncharacterized protein n=1 Tax=Giardia muris TaxID=5742 RepID=A0A4Z1T3P6_GIAMU|nr:hypothetical protein GMRT_11052 [Giardia muris]|eukprot:TNJ27159.1 hypothetical protein GMRT_11052 [Giardia muris]